MKIVKLITSHGGSSYTGKGGHYYSCSILGKTLSKYYNVEIFSFGKNPSPVLNNMSDDLNVSHIQIDKIRDLLFFYKNKKLAASIEACDVIHCYDKPSIYQAFKLGRIWNKPVIVTKCGGPSPQGLYYPFVKNIIVFSKEDVDYFSSKSKYDDSNIHHIPNRVLPIETDYERIQTIENKMLKEYKIKILIIARFTKKYREALLQTIKFANKLRSQNVSCATILLGHNQNREVLEEVKERSGEDDYIINDNKLCDNAKQIIPVADLVIGSGRSIMEAAQFGKILMIPVPENEYPVLLTQDNIEVFLKHNMTGRGIDGNNYVNYDEIINTFKNPSYSQFIKNYYGKNFSVDNAIHKYKKIYKSLANSGGRFYGGEYLLLANNLKKYYLI